MAFRHYEDSAGEPATPSIFISKKGIKNMRTRNVSVPFRVTEKELEAIDKKAEKAKMNRTEYLITAATNKRITLIEDIKPLLTELRRIGNNLNQITKLANMGKVDAINLTETSEALAETYQAVYLLARTNGGANWQS